MSVALFFGLQTENVADPQAEKSTPLEVALINHQPTLLEFYANWCTTCQAMAKDLGEIKQEYGKNVNFVILKVNTSNATDDPRSHGSQVQVKYTYSSNVAVNCQVRFLCRA